MGWLNFFKGLGTGAVPEREIVDEDTPAHWWHCDTNRAFCGWPLDDGEDADTEYDDSRDEGDCPLCVVIYYTNGGCPLCVRPGQNQGQNGKGSFLDQVGDLFKGVVQ